MKIRSGIFLAALAFAASHCSSSASHRDGASGTDAPCSKDGSDSIAWGAYTGGSVNDPNQSLILLPGPGCGICWDLYSQDGQDMSQGSTWSSAWAADHKSIVITVNPALSIDTIAVSPDGALLLLTDTITGTPAGFRKSEMPLASCDGQSPRN